jgi:hypothetical protein
VTAVMVAGATDGPTGGPTPADLKNPVIWMTQAHALSEAATVLVKSSPSFESMPVLARGICDGQFCAVALMLVGYSLEVCLKAMELMRRGVDEYAANERELRHHDLRRLAHFVPDLSEKDMAVLEGLTHFVVWAGRYPDPGGGREEHRERVFALAERHQIAGRDLFGTATRVMAHASVVVG